MATISFSDIQREFDFNDKSCKLPIIFDCRKVMWKGERKSALLASHKYRPKSGEIAAYQWTSVFIGKTKILKRKKRKDPPRLRVPSLAFSVPKGLGVCDLEINGQQNIISEGKKDLHTFSFWCVNSWRTSLLKMPNWWRRTRGSDAAKRRQN